MDVRDRSTYTPSLESPVIGAASRARTDAQSNGEASGVAANRDSSNLSPAAQVVAQAMQMPDLRQDRIASLQQQIATGGYRVASQDVADAMLRHFAG